MRDIPVSLLDFSLSGCRIGSNLQIDAGTAGDLRLNVGGKEYQDTVRVVRSTRSHGSSHAFTLGGTFTFGNRPGAASVRAEVPSIVPRPG